MSRARSVVCALCACIILVSAPIAPSHAATISLQDSTWELLVVPANSSSATVESLFSSALPPNDYKFRWILYSYDSGSNEYYTPELDQALLPGQAFWVIQITGSTVQLDLANGLPVLEANPGLICSQAQACIGVSLETTEAIVTWNMVGVSLLSDTNIAATRYVNAAGDRPCSAGCSLQEAFEDDQFTGALWYYDSAANAYVDAVATGQVPKGRGFWIGMLPDAENTSPSLHIPVPPGSTDTVDCTWYVSPDGDDGANGSNANAAFASVSVAVERLEAGDTACLMPGTYAAPIVIQDKTGTAEQPITLKSLNNDPDDVIVEDALASLITGIVVTNSSHINVSGVKVQNVLRGIQYNSVDGGSVSDNVITQIQQEGIRVGALNGNNGLSGNPSSNIRVAGNRISDTGRRIGQSPQGFDYNEFGEGIYIGTGKYSNDATNNIVVSDNIISGVTAEGIEIKPYTRDIRVIDNTISSTNLKYAGAITVAVGPRTVEDGNYEISGNRIFDVTSRQYSVAGIVVGQGNADIRDNIVWDVEGGRGIRVYTTFVLEGANNVVIANNTVWTPGESNDSIAIHDGNGGFGLNILANVTAVNNLTDDGSGATTATDASAFIGPLSGTADNGGGPGSGFILQ